MDYSKRPTRLGRSIDHLAEVSHAPRAPEPWVAQASLSHVMQKVLLDLAPLLAQTQTQVEVALPEAAALSLSEKNLCSVVYNLLSKALKYCHLQLSPLIRIACVHTNHHFMLTIQDNGRGLSEPQ